MFVIDALSGIYVTPTVAIFLKVPMLTCLRLRILFSTIHENPVCKPLTLFPRPIISQQSPSHTVVAQIESQNIHSL